MNCHTRGLWLLCTLLGILPLAGCANKITLRGAAGQKLVLDVQNDDEIQWSGVTPQFVIANPCKGKKVAPCKVSIEGNWGQYVYKCAEGCPDPELEVGSVPNDELRRRQAAGNSPAIYYACEDKKIDVNTDDFKDGVKVGDTIPFTNVGSGSEQLSDWKLKPAAASFCQSDVDETHPQCKINGSPGMTYSFTLTSSKCGPTDPPAMIKVNP